MFDEEKNKTIDFLCEKAADIVTDEEGIKLFIELVNSCSSKNKKALIKLYKGNITEIVNNNNVAYVSVIKLLTEVDDTVLIAKSFLPEIVDLLAKVCECKKAFSLIFSIFSPRNHNFNVLGKYEHTV
jgi:hypothetical protein